MLTTKKIALVFAVLLMVLNLRAQSDSTTLAIDDDQTMLVGKCERIELQNEEFSKHFFEAYRSYKPDQELLEKIKNKIFNYDVTIILATWCHDSHQQVPGFIKILDALDYNTNYLKIICLDKKKQAGDYDIATLDIEKVPTFIVYKENTEVGRIIESPSNTFEIDIYNIIKE